MAAVKELSMYSLSRRSLLTMLAGAPLAACVSPGQESLAPVQQPSGQHLDMDGWYTSAVEDASHAYYIVNPNLIAPELRRQGVAYNGPGEPGTVVVNVGERHLYFVEDDGQATRYGIGVGRAGFAWRGAAKVGRKRAWPDWGPTVTMRELNPKLPQYMAAGIRNPLGARALYLYQGGRDTLFRIHGTNEPWTIGQAVSSGCVRMFNEDIVDLYERVEVGTPVMVQRAGRVTA